MAPYRISDYVNTYALALSRRAWLSIKSAPPATVRRSGCTRGHAGSSQGLRPDSLPRSAEWNIRAEWCCSFSAL